MTSWNVDGTLTARVCVVCVSCVCCVCVCVCASVYACVCVSADRVCAPVPAATLLITEQYRRVIDELQLHYWQHWHINCAYRVYAQSVNALAARRFCLVGARVHVWMILWRSAVEKSYKVMQILMWLSLLTLPLTVQRCRWCCCRSRWRIGCCGLACIIVGF